MLQPRGFKAKAKGNLIWRLNKSLYGLKYVLKCWCKKFDYFITSVGYDRLDSNPCDSDKRFDGDDRIALLLYVVNMLIGSKKHYIKDFKADLAKEFEMKETRF